MTIANNQNDDGDILVEHEEQPDQLLDNAYTEYVSNNYPSLSVDEETSYNSVELPAAMLAPKQSPVDRYKFAYMVFYLLGTATMTPWNFFITAEDYWMYKFRNTTLNESDSGGQAELTPLQKSFPSDLTITASIAGTIFLILNAIYGQHVSLRLKMVGTLSIISIVFTVTMAFVEINTDQWQMQFFYLTLVSVIIINICSATMSGAVFGFAGLFPSEYMSALVSGQALGGIFTSLAFIVALSFGSSPKTTAFAYFSIGNCVIIISIVTYVIMSSQDFFKSYIYESPESLKFQTKTIQTSSSLPYNQNEIVAGIALEPNLCEVFRKVFVYAIGICTLFIVTLSVYPAVTVLTQSQNFGKGNKWNDIYFMPVTNYLGFNVGDYLGRIIAGLMEKPRNNPHTVLILTVLRAGFIPFFLMTNSNVHSYLPILVHSDFIFITMIIAFGVTNGYLANNILIMAPRSVMQHEKELASSIMAASLSCGLTIGAALSMLFVQLL